MTDYADFEEGMPKSKTPVFLKVLCILTFVSCGLSLISTVYGLIGGEAQLRKSIHTMEQAPAKGPFSDMASGLEQNFEEIAKWSQLSHIMMLGCIALTLAGALMMWKLKKSGYYLYLPGQALSVTSSIFGYFAMKDIPLMGTGVLIGLIVGTLFILAFVIMYGLNLKHMR